ncbi:MAG: type I-U CRISPR-associated protein Csx17 [Gammaproteobacteria bacterium]
MNEIMLPGCTPTPLANYLKALGILRLLSAKYPETRGCWRGDLFVLLTPLDEQSVLDFFLNDYEPTPLVAPWGARSGFYKGASEKTAREALSQMEVSDKERLQSFRDMIQLVRGILLRYGIHEKPSDEEKLELLRICRSELPDRLLEWLDTCYLLTGDDRKFPPLLGTGGNEGSGSYVSGFAQQIVACVADRKHDAALSASLFGHVLPDIAMNQTPGHFSPSDAGGLNASVGFEDNRAGVNPWDYILTLEGTLVFASAAVRRSANDPAGILSYPFTVHAVCAGAGSYAKGDASKPRGEMWLPLWRQPASYTETRALLAEGRVALGRKPAHDALDFVRAVHHLGGYRGIGSFQRYGLLERNGRSYFATPLSRVQVSDEPQSNLLDELDKHNWLNRFRKFCRGDNTPNRFLMLCRQLEDRLFDLSGHKPNKAEIQSLIILLDDIHQAMATSQKVREEINPVPQLSEHWVNEADDGTPEFRIAKALAGLHGVGDQPLPLRAQLFPVERKFSQWMTPDSNETVRFHSGQKARLIDTLYSLLERRLWLTNKLGMKDKPLASPAGATLDDIAAFLQDDYMDRRIASLLPGLSLCDIPKDTDRSAGDGALPAAFGLMKLALTPNHILQNLGYLGVTDELPIPTGMLAQLGAGNQGNKAVQIAYRRLRASGLAPYFAKTGIVPTLAGIRAERATAALLIPLRYGATGTLARNLLEEPETEANMATTV